MVGGLIGNLAFASASIPETVDVDLSGLVDITLMILSALCVVWIGRKLVRMMNRS